MEKTFNFGEVADELLRAYKKLILKKDPNYNYKGVLLTTNKILAVCPNIDESLSFEEIEYRRKEKGVSPMQSFISATLQLGIEQGLRMAAEDDELKKRDFLSSYINSPLEDIDKAIATLEILKKIRS